MTDDSDMKFILTATRKEDNARLHLVRCDSVAFKYVVCWNYDTSTKTCNWGTYCDNLTDALEVFVEKLREHEF